MTRYKYNSQWNPPAPFVHVTVRSFGGEKATSLLPAQLDTAADRTVLPWHVVEELGLDLVREVPIAGVGRHVELMPMFLAQIEVRQLAPLAVEALASKEEPFMLLGRDVLNHYHVVLDGPQLALEIG